MSTLMQTSKNTARNTVFFEKEGEEEDEVLKKDITRFFQNNFQLF